MTISGLFSATAFKQQQPDHPPRPQKPPRPCVRLRSQGIPSPCDTRRLPSAPASTSSMFPENWTVIFYLF